MPGKNANLERLRELTVQLTASSTDHDTEEQVSSAAFSAMIETSSECYWSLNFNGGIGKVSKGFKRTLGYSVRKKIPSWLEYVADDDSQVVQSQLEEHFTSKGKAAFNVLARFEHKKGHPVWILCRGKVVRWSKDGEPIEMIGTHISLEDCTFADCACEKCYPVKNLPNG